jgi:hypothetical protein
VPGILARQFLLARPDRHSVDSDETAIREVRYHQARYWPNVVGIKDDFLVMRAIGRQAFQQHKQTAAAEASQVVDNDS